MVDRLCFANQFGMLHFGLIAYFKQKVETTESRNYRITANIFSYVYAIERFDIT